MGRRKNLVLEPSLEEAIRSGLVERVSDRVVVPAKYSPIGRDLVEPYGRLAVSERIKDPEAFVRAALAMCGGDIDQLRKHFNTAFDTAARVPIRHRLVRGAKKPQKSLERAAKALVEAGAARSVDEALRKLADTFRVPQG